MKMREFAEKVCTAVTEELGVGYKAEVGKVRKNNGVFLYGLQITDGKQDATPVIYLEPFWEGYKSGALFVDVIRGLVDVYRESMPKGDINMEFYRHYEMVKDRICYRLVGRKENEALLKDIPHTEFLDLAVCFYYALDFDKEGLGEGSILVRNAHMEAWGVSMEELFRQAQSNTPRIFPWEYIPLEKIMAGIMQEEGEEFIPEDLSREVPMKVLSNSRRMYGAACMLYPGVLAGIAAKEKSNLYIIPSSLHELILLPDDGVVVAEELKKMIFEVNRTQVIPEDVLSDSLYYYDREKGEVIMA